MQPGRSPSETTQGTQPPSTQLEEVEDEVPLDEEADEEADFGATGGDAHAATFGSPTFALATAFFFLYALVDLAFSLGLTSNLRGTAQTQSRPQEGCH